MEWVSQKCKAHSSRTGKPCANYAIPGGSVCRYHGGAAGQVQQAARLRLAALVDPAIEVLAKLLKPGKGRYVKPELQLNAAKDALDRAGLKTADKLEVGTYTIDPKSLSDDQLRAVMALREQLAERQTVKS